MTLVRRAHIGAMTMLNVPKYDLYHFHDLFLQITDICDFALSNVLSSFHQDKTIPATCRRCMEAARYYSIAWSPDLGVDLNPLDAATCRTWGPGGIDQLRSVDGPNSFMYLNGRKSDYSVMSFSLTKERT